MDDRDFVAFVDVDWISPDEESLPALVVDASGALWWGKEQILTGEKGAAVRVAELIASYAAEIVRIVSGFDVSRIEVIGRGVIAAEVRRRLGRSMSKAGQRPLAVIELTGDTTELARATHSVDDGGLVVLGGEPHGVLELNLYTDVHRRGLQVIGVPGVGVEPESDGNEPRELPEPVSVSAGEQLPFGSWYRISR